MKKLSLLLILSLFAVSAWAAGVKVGPRMSYYTSEKSAEIIVYMPDAQGSAQVAGSSEVGLKKGLNLLSVPASKLALGDNTLTVKVTANGKTEEHTAKLTKLAPHGNEVKIDYTTGGITVNGKPWFPVGFYASNAPETYRMCEVEVTNGMNLYSPYQGIDDATLNSRMAYLDMCAAIGMKVNYNVCSLAGSQGIGIADGSSTHEKLERLKREINMVKDHPAILSYYIADEPDGQGVPIDLLEGSYNTIKALDPYHPISIVIISADPARRFINTYDIIMADPYPVPHSAAVEAPMMMKEIYDEVKFEKAIWLVPQTFGGGEVWQREPTHQEHNLMCYASLVEGTMGFQAFIRNGLLGNPTSPLLWKGYVNTALELRDIYPYLYDISAVRLTTSDPQIIAKEYHLNGNTLIIAVNLENKPKNFSVTLADKSINADARLIFENREVAVKNGVIEDIIIGFGTNVFKISGEHKSIIKASNLAVNPSFEESVEAGATNGGAGSSALGGMTLAIDPTEAVDGEYSMRLINPTRDGGARRSLYPVDNENDRTYIMSVWAKADPRSLKVNADKGEKMTFKMAFGRLGEGEFELTDQWKRYEIVIAPQQMVRKGHGGAAGSISLIGEGTAWFDALEVNPEIYMATELTPDGKGFVVNMLCNIEDGEIRYTTDGSEPTQKSKVYTSPIEFRDVRTVKARVFDGDKALNTKTMLVAAHKALGAKVAYNKPWTKYTGGGETALTDGKFATMNYQSPMWQGYRGNDIDVTVDLGEVKPINKITTSYLYSLTAWVVPPSDIEFEISEDGKTFATIGAVKYGEAPKGIGEYDYVPVSIVKDKIGGKKARYIHIKAKHPLGMPSWRNVQGDSWMFIDEIVVE